MIRLRDEKLARAPHILELYLWGGGTSGHDRIFFFLCALLDLLHVFLTAHLIHQTSLTCELGEGLPSANFNQGQIGVELSKLGDCLNQLPRGHNAQ